MKTIIIASLLAFGALGFFGCNTVDNTVDCHGICNRYQECFDEKYDRLFLREVRQHMMNGLYGQTVIHPRHVRPIRDAYRVSKPELESAEGIVGTSTAVLGLNGKMDERATHLKWAELIIARHRLFGDALPKKVKKSKKFIAAA